MPVDRPDEDDAVLDTGGGTGLDVAEPRVSRVSAETRDPVTYYTELRAAVAAERWEATVSHFAERWTDHEQRWPSSAERDGDAERTLDSVASTEVDRAYDRIRDVEKSVITPAMLEIEAEDSGRELVGLDHRLKGDDRLKEKVADYLWADPDATPVEAVSMIPDIVRFTFCYTDENYASDVRADLERLDRHGFELVRSLKNSWESDQYKGINTQWREAEAGVRFEVQFHTETSFEAKQLTHGAYERLRRPDTSDSEREELEELQHEMCAKVPIPPGATEIEHYPWKERDG